MAKEEALTKRAMEGLKKVPHLHILGDEAPENHTGIVAFTIEGVHPHDVSEIFHQTELMCVRVITAHSRF